MVASAGSCKSVVDRVNAFSSSYGVWQSVFGVCMSLHHGCDLLALDCRWYAARLLGSRWRHRMSYGTGDHHARSENIVMPDDDSYRVRKLFSSRV